MFLRVRDGIKSIPEKYGDIRRAVKRRVIFECAACIVWFAAIIAISAVFGYYNDILKILIVLAVAVAPVFKWRLWRRFTDSTYEGVISACKNDSRTVTKRIYSGANVASLTTMYIQKLTVTLPDGKVKHIKLRRLEGESAPTYHEGEGVRHYYGTKFPLKLYGFDDVERHPIVCVMCGTRNNPDEDRCGICGKSLINNGCVRELGSSDEGNAIG